MRAVLPALLALVLPFAAGAKGAGPPPRARAHYPAAAAMGVATDVIAVRFSRPMDLSSLPDGGVTVDLAGGSVPGTWSLDPLGRDRVAVFAPTAPLPPAAGVRLRVTEAARSDTGVPAVPYEFLFRTAPTKPATGPVVAPAEGEKLRKPPSRGPRPRVVYTFPNAGFGNAYTDTIRIRFSRPMDGEGGFEEQVRVLQSGAQKISGTLAFDPASGGTELVFTPDFPLFRGTDYEVVLDPWLRSSRGRLMEQEFRFGFGTSPMKDGIRPLSSDDFLQGPVLSIGRAFHTASSVHGGDVILCGGQDYSGNPLRSVERYIHNFQSTMNVASMTVARRKHAAAEMKDGRVMVIGGFGDSGVPISSVEIYDPIADGWSTLPSLGVARANHVATVLNDGSVLVTGGFTNGPSGLAYTNTAERYNPITGDWSFVGSMTVGRGGHTGTMLKDGRVLLLGGAMTGVGSAEIYEPGPKAFVATPTAPQHHRMFHCASITKAGSVLVAGGGPPVAEQFDPATGIFSNAGTSSPMNLPGAAGPDFATLTLLSEGRVVLIGGLAYGLAFDGSDLVLAQVQIWHASGSGGHGAFFPMHFAIDPPRAGHTVTPLEGGEFLLAGGFGTGSPASGNERRLTILKPD